MIRARKKSIALITALIFMLSIVAPMAAFAAADDYTNFSSTYRFVSTGKDVDAGTATITCNVSDGPYSGDTDEVVVRLDLPDGVEFSDTPTRSTVSASAYKDFAADSDYVEITFDATNWVNGTKVSVNFTTNPIDIDSDFTGDVLVRATVTGIDKGKNDVTFTDWDDLVIAKVSAADINVTAEDPEAVTMGTATLAKITIEEGQAGAFNDGDPATGDADWIRFDIMTNGVTFDLNETDFGKLRLDWAFLNRNENASTDASGALNDDNDSFKIYITESSKGLPGAITFTPAVKIDPTVTGEIKIRVSSNNKDMKSTTLVVGEVGDVTGVIEEVEDNDTVVYAGSRGTELDVTFEINPVGSSEFDDGIVSLTLNNGKFVEGKEPTVFIDGSEVEATLYNSDKSVYFDVKDGDESIEVSEIWVACDNDVEEGDIVLTAGGNLGVEGEVVVGQFAKPFTVTAETPNILSEALNQAAGDLIITEVDAEALAPFEDVYVDGEPVNVEKTAVFFELPSGIELKGTPKVDVTEGNIDVDIEVVDDNIIALIIEGDSSDASTIEISGIRYDTGRLALTGPVELEAYFAYYAEDEWETVDGVLCTVANAIVGDQNTVTASFTVGDEGVAIVNGRTLVQVNLLCDVLGLQKSWDAAEKTAYFVKDGKVVAFPMGENAVYINGVKVPMDQGGMIINDFTYATLRGLEAAFGGTLDWDNDTKTATFVFNK